MSGTNHDHDYYHDDCGLCQLEKAELLETVVDKLLNGELPTPPPAPKNISRS